MARVRPRRDCRRWFYRRCAGLVAGLLLVFAGTTGAWAEDGTAAFTVRETEVSVDVLGVQPAPALIGRIRETLQSMADRALVGRSVSGVAQLESAVAKALREVLDRVLLGYRVQEISVTAGEKAAVRLTLAPEGPIVKDAFVRLEVDGIDPQLSSLLTEHMGELDGYAREALAGLPVKAFEWGRVVLEPLVERRLAGLLPGFRVAFHVDLDEAAVLTVRLTPDSPKVTLVDARLISDTIPALVLRDMRGRLRDHAQILRGLPVAFLTKYRDEIQDEVDHLINGTAVVRDLGLAVRSRLVPAEATRLQLQVESKRYRLRAEGVVSIGVSVPGPELRWRTGVGLGVAEVFFANHITLTGLSSRWWGGVGIPLGLGGELTWRRDLGNGEERFGLAKRIRPDRRLRFEGDPRTREWEAVYGITTDEYITVELGAARGRFWAALVGNL